MKSNIQNFEVWKQEAETVMEKMAHDLVQAVDGKYEAPQHIKERVRKKTDQDNDDSK